MSGPLVTEFAYWLLVFFRMFFRRRQALETLQEFLFGHALDGNLGVVGIDARTG